MLDNDRYAKEADKRFSLHMDKELFEKCAKLHRRSVAKEIETAAEIYLDYADGMHKDGRYF